LSRAKDFKLVLMQQTHGYIQSSMSDSQAAVGVGCVKMHVTAPQNCNRMSYGYVRLLPKLG
jgi:hypothetical protein